MAGAGGADVSVRLTGKNLDNLGSMADDIADRLKTIRGTVDASTDYRPDIPELVIEPKPEIAGLFGITEMQLARAVATAIAGDNSIEITLDDEDVDIRLQLAPEYQKTVSELKRLAAPHLMDALSRSAAINSRLVPLAAELEALGRDPEVVVGDPATLVMLEGRDGRDRLLRDGQGFRTRRSGETFTLADLSSIAASSPERLSPNVLLRPVVESAVLPTVAYLGGPGELRYLLYTPPVYERLGVERQLPMPRWSGVMVEPKVDRALEKFGVTLDELLGPPGALEARLVRSQLPPEVTGALASLRAAIERDYETIGQRAVEIDPTLARPVEGVRNQALAGTQDLEKKLIQHLKRRQETELGQIGRARTAVQPGGKPQERVLTVAPFLAREGPRLVEELVSAIEQWYATALEGASTPS